MINTITVTGMVIGSLPVGEVDKRITILTAEKGKIGVFAKGSRRPTSQLLSSTQLFSFGTYMVVEGKDSYTLSGADIKTSFADLYKDMDAMYYGMYFCEFAAFMTRENVPAKKELNLLYASLRALEKRKIEPTLIRSVFELRFLTENGEMPSVYQCVGCKETSVLIHEKLQFSARKGGVLCPDCFLSDAITISKSTVYTMQYIVSAPMERLFAFTVVGFVEEELGQICKEFLAVTVGHHMKSEEMLEIIADDKKSLY